MIQPVRTSVKKRKSDQLLGWFILLFGGYLVIVLSKGLWEIKQAYKRLDEAEMVLKAEEVKQTNLTYEIVEATSPAYIEKVAREELGMQRLGETLVILPNDRNLEFPDNSIQGDLQEKTKEKDRENWQKWWDLVK